jgi:hypothetical protein
MAKDQQHPRDFQFHGLALSSLDTKIPLEKVQEKAIGPCSNCQYLIKAYLGVYALENFIPKQQ